MSGYVSGTDGISYFCKISVSCNSSPIIYEVIYERMAISSEIRLSRGSFTSRSPSHFIATESSTEVNFCFFLCTERIVKQNKFL